ncbi:unnamed protein product [Adineta ricciae]|uniref:Uncharacterized protein n=1 Tax=Adineta ricciae TaxID=249248 RepID=A0A814WP53_ADIRI|nr:unnamed protein product [Adineta ricciae]
MYVPQRPGPYIYNAPPYGIPTYATVSYPPSSIDIHWYNAWPRVRIILLAITMLICSAALISLDIANLAIEGSKSNDTSKFGSGPGKVGAGIWSGTVAFVASICILNIVFLKNKRQASTSALIAVTLAFFLMIVLVGLTGNTVQTNLYLTNVTDADKIQHKLLIAMLSSSILFSILSSINKILNDLC